jgi:uncharacterized protein (DUF1778 family)
MSAQAEKSRKLDIRLSGSDRRTVEAAASASKRTLSAFIRESALAYADEVLADRRTFVLSKEEFSKFEAALAAPIRPLPRMQRLLTEPGLFDPPNSTSATDAQRR